MKSLRRFLLSRLLVGAALILALAGAATSHTLLRSQRQQFDRALLDRVQGLAALLFQRENRLSFEFSGELMPEFEREENPSYFQLQLANGTLVERSETLEEWEVGLDTPLGLDDEPRWWTAQLPDGRSGRYVARRIEVHHVRPEEGPQRPTPARVDIVIAVPRDELMTAELRVLSWVLAGTGGVLLGLLLLGHLVVRRALEPARSLAQALEQVRVEALPEQLEATRELPLELEPMATTANHLIQRVRRALERERRTSADIAHELRTPLSELLTVSEVALRGGEDRRELRGALITVRDVTWRMERSVSTLLALARIEMGDHPASFLHEDVDLRSLVSDARAALASQERERGLELELEMGPDSVVHNDPTVLRILVANLIGNALTYTPEEGRVRVRFDRGRDPDRRWSLCVENDAPDLEPKDMQALTEPFWRKDDARVDRDHAGLGLTLSRALAKRAGLTLEFEFEESTFRARVAG